MKSRYWKIAFAYVGVIVGAGLSSGQDLLQYFLSFGKKGLLGVALLGILNIVFGRIMVTLGCYFRSDNHEEVFSEIAHPLITKILDYVLVVGDFVMGFVMVAGAGSNLQQQFGLPSWVGALICSLLIIAVAFMDFDKITGVLGIFTPVMIGMIFLMTIYTFVGHSYDFSALDAAAKTIEPAMNNLWLSVFNYYALCAMTGVGMAFILGGSVVRIGVAEKGGTIGGIMIALTVMAASLSLFANIDEVKDAEMPMLAIVNNIHPYLAFFYAFTIFALIFNTAFSLYYAIARRYSGGDTKKMRMILIAVVIVGYVCSFGGFRSLIGLMYPLLGFMGMLLLAVLLIGWYRKRQNIITEKFLRRKLIQLMLKKHDDSATVTKADRRMFHFLMDHSPVDNEQLRQDIHASAERIVENVDDIQEFVETSLSVDDDMLRQSIEETVGESL